MGRIASNDGNRNYFLSDTVGQAVPLDIGICYHVNTCISPKLSLAHIFILIPNSGYEKLTAAFDSGCRRFDGAILGIGGCPMAGTP